ncbi:MAG: DNA repair protein RecN [Aggregatilineales bacterium]|nr:DNA repair protein RecN [Chloroflexota bacterium]HOA22406.1 DNA repair protein RecN [Aggregatilineales bacterium]HPV08561.1 DNA repair protein RecN [Aggregatilineales bacterium]
MLSEITIRDFAIIDHLTLRFSPGFNVLTGETGAGKSIILDAVSLLLGGRASHDDIRAGAESALVEGIFILRNESTREAINALLEREALEGDAPDLLVLTREVRRGGRNICRVNGRVVTLSILQEISEGLVDIHGQTEHLSLLKPAYHLDLLDRYGGLMEKRRAFSQLVRQVEAVRAELHNLITNRDELAMRAEMLNYKVEEIRAANLKPGEEEDLRDEARRLANAEQIAELVSEAYQAIYVGGEGRGSAADLLTEAANALARLVKLDPAAEEMSTLAEELSIQAEELSRSLADYQANIEFDPARLQEAELRLDLIRSLKRKYHADTIEELLEGAEQAAREVENIENSSERIEQLQAEEAVLLARIGEAASELSKLRQACAERLARAVEAELADLRMADAHFQVSITQEDDPAGCPVGDYRLAFTRTGIDQVEFLISPNIGEPFKPIARIASGGETSRIMLALKTVLSRADETPTLIFDEIDAGIGGRIGAVVGQKLWSLSSAHQVLVVTHLPQLAGFSDAHFKVEKQLKGSRTVTRVFELEREKQIEELTAMLGAEAESARQSAEELLNYVESIKKQAALSAGG